MRSSVRPSLVVHVLSPMRPRGVCHTRLSTKVPPRTRSGYILKELRSQKRCVAAITPNRGRFAGQHVVSISPADEGGRLSTIDWHQEPRILRHPWICTFGVREPRLVVPHSETQGVGFRTRSNGTWRVSRAAKPDRCRHVGICAYSVTIVMGKSPQCVLGSDGFCSSNR